VIEERLRITGLAVGLGFFQLNVG